MPKYIPITEDLCLVEQNVKTKKVVTKRESINHLWIYDRSGSMTYLLPELTSQLIKLSKSLKKGDSLSLGWFSSEGQYNWVFKGFKIADTSDYKALERAIKNNSSSIGMTCFSEILLDTETVIKDLSVISKAFSFHFFTDGYPVVNNYQKEISGIFKAINAIKGKIRAAMFVAYGPYYNRDLLTKMSEKLGALLIHSSLIPEYSNSITKLMALTENQESKEEIEPILNNPLNIFSIADEGVILYSPEDDGKLYINPQKGKDTQIYYISSEKPNKKNWDKIEISEINFGDINDSHAKALYSGILVLTQQTRTDLALEMAGKIGDKRIINSLTNAFTVEEYGNCENEVNACIEDISLRFTEGRDPNYLPPIDAFCAFDVLKILIEDKEAAFYPYHEKFSYEKIGVASKTAAGYPSFKPDKTSKCPFNDLTWHNCRMNLSVRTNIKGSVVLNDSNGMTPEFLNLEREFPSFIFRNYTFIKDGRVHLKKFFISTSEDTYKLFKNKGIVVEDSFSSTGVYGLDVSGLPAINRAIAVGKTSATEMCHRVLEEQKLKGLMKGLKWLKEQEFPKEIYKEPTDYNESQIKFLADNGIDATKGGVYNPPREFEEKKDMYMAKTFEIKVKGLSSLPAVDKVKNKIASGKSRTLSESLVEEALIKYEGVKKGMPQEMRLKWFENNLSLTQKSLNAVRSRIQENKMSVILGNRWFEEFDSREDCNLELKGNKFNFVLSEEAVDI